jgi:hypothetical protein
MEASKGNQQQFQNFGALFSLRRSEQETLAKSEEEIVRTGVFTFFSLQFQHF